MKTSKTMLLALTSALSLAIGAGSAFADNVCEPDLEVAYDSGHGTSVKIVAFQYRLDGKNMPWHREDVPNVVLNKGSAPKVYKAQRLGSISKGQKMEVRVVFAADAGRGYGAEEPSAQTSAMKACENNKSYAVTIK